MNTNRFKVFQGHLPSEGPSGPLSSPDELEPIWDALVSLQDGFEPESPLSTDEELMTSPEMENYEENGGQVEELLSQVTVAGSSGSSNSSSDGGSSVPIPPWNPETMQILVDDHSHELRAKMMAMARDPLWAPKWELSLDEARHLCWVRCKALAASGLISLGDLKEDPLKYTAFNNSLVYLDASTCVKFGVQYSLWGGTVMNLGTERHHHLLPDIESMALPGCFAMTELGHGSNVRGLETTATYVHSTRSFIIHTPSDSAQKVWIGNAACHAYMATVFAQLYVNGEHHGVHAFLVPIRNPDGTHTDGVTIRDMGHKMGMNGVDNGRLWFDQVTIPRENLLNRHGDVTPDGVYVSPIKHPLKRFAAMLSELVNGRVSVSSSANNIAKMGLSVAVRYAFARRAFAPPGAPVGAPETPLIDYMSHARRLIPHVASVYAFAFANNKLVRLAAEGMKSPNWHQVHILASGLKALTTWNKTACLQECREACGGQGFSSYNRIGGAKTDSDVDLTYEGDNTVLLQQVTKDLLSAFARRLKSKGLIMYSVEQLGAAVRDKNPMATRNTSRAHLESAEFGLRAFQYREQTSIAALARSLASSGGRSRASRAAAWQANTDRVSHVARTHIELVVLQEFWAVIRRSDPTLRPVLSKLASLYALTRIEADLAWFLEAGFVSAAKAQAIRNTINALCLDIKPVLLDLLDSWGIAPEDTHAPISHPDYLSRFDRDSFPPSESDLTDLLLREPIPNTVTAQGISFPAGWMVNP